MSYTSGSFVADEQPTTAKWNLLWGNDAFFNDFITGSRYLVGSFSVTATGSKAITGVGFQPKAVMFLASTQGAVSSTANAGIAVGVADEDLNQADVDGVTRNTHGGFSETITTAALSTSTIAAGGGSRAASIEFDITSMDSDGFTINVTTYAATRTVAYLAMK